MVDGASGTPPVRPSVTIVFAGPESTRYQIKCDLSDEQMLIVKGVIEEIARVTTGSRVQDLFAPKIDTDLSGFPKNA